MKPATIGVLGLAALAVWFFTRHDPDEPRPSEAPKPHPVTIKEPEAPVLADDMLADYASNDTSGAEDLNMMARFLDSVFLLVKQRDTADYATNEDLALFLMGENSHRSPFLSRSHIALNDQGQLVDRWGSPLIVHPISQKLLELRSAGPDEKAYTEDDLEWPAPK